MRIPIVVVPGSADETVARGELPEAYLQRVVREKLASVATRINGVRVGGLLAADTIVLLDGAILGKPADEAEARRMLWALSGRGHEVRTRFAVASAAHPAVPIHEETVCSKVHFRSVTTAEIDGYASSGEGLDKAGAYAVQGLGAFAVKRVDGSYSNVVGLPACEVVSALLEKGLLAKFPL
ncbi:MAG: Maf family protein [Polyangiaceae bacterium]|nr:Maf family protein [Polyangiaceae bacterium]